MKSKRGVNIGFSGVILALMVLFVVIIAVVTLINYSRFGQSDLGSALQQAIETVTDTFMQILGPLFRAILGLGANTNTNFLMILTFVLLSIIIVGALDSVNIFGDDNKGGIINLFVGVIVSIIGVRFMPTDLWISLTAPSSAFVATILVGAPFLALFFVTMKIKYPLARKLVWLFYLIVLSYLILFPVPGGRAEIGLLGLNDFAWIYIVFWILAILMLFFETFVRKFIFKQTAETALLQSLGVDYAKRAAEIEEEISDLIEKKGATRNKKRQRTFDVEIARLKREFKKVTGEEFY